jgi:lipopolysaccharide exporter
MDPDDLEPRIKGATGRALGWQSLSAGLMQVLTAAVAMLVAARTSPGEFALWAIAVIMIQAQFVLRLGLGPSLIYAHFLDRQELQRSADSAFSFMAWLSVAVAVVVFAFARSLASLFGEGFSTDEVVLVVRVMCIVFVFLALEDIPIALIEKTIDFRRRSIVELATSVLYAGTVVGLLVGGIGVWSLVIAKVGQSVARTVAFWWVAPVRPRLRIRIEWTCLPSLLRYGSILAIIGLISFGSSNLDNIAAGRVFGASALGVYALAFTLANFIPTFLSESVGKVFFPLYAAMRDSVSTLRVVFLSSIHVVAAVMVPTAIVLLVFGPRLLFEVFGPQWHEGAVILQVLAAYAFARALGEISTSMRSATGRPGLSLLARAAGLVASLAALWPLLSLGLVGIPLAFTFGQAVIALIAFLSIPREWRRGTLGAFVPGLSAGLVAAGIGFAFGLLMFGYRGLTGTAAFVITYVPLVLFFDRSLRGLARGLARRAGAEIEAQT